MQILENFLYVLIEGEPDSPEVAFINRVISNLIAENTLPKLDYEVLEVGGSGSFNSIAKMIYKKSILHKFIPVLAVADKDFRSHEQVNNQSRSNDELIQAQSVRFIYWQRHEWENFILEETSKISHIVNQIPRRKDVSTHKPSRIDITASVTEAELNSWILEYFNAAICQELIECLRFRFRMRVNSNRIALPRFTNNANSISFSDVERWFEEQIVDISSQTAQSITSLSSVLLEISQEVCWQNWLDSSGTLDFNQAKRLFRGKEALKYLFNQITRHLQINNLSYDTFIQQILLPELESDSDTLIIQELASMLSPYFLAATNALRRLAAD